MIYTDSKFFRMNILFIATIIFLSAFFQCHTADAIQISDYEIDAKLRELKPLPKVHYFWPLWPQSKTSDKRLYELARITHTICLLGDLVTAEQVERYVYTCAKVNKTTPSIKTSLGVVFVPWHQKFDKNLPPTDRGPSYYEELDHFEQRATLVKQWIEQSNKKYHSNVKVTAVLLDCERFAAKPGNKEWNEGMRQALDAIHTRAQSFFPGAQIEWYDRGIHYYSWTKSPYWTGKEITTSLSCSLYTVPEIEHTREIFRRTCKLADEMAVSDVTPWVALAAGTRRSLEGVYFDADWRYDIIYSYQIGAELNNKWYSDRPEKYAPYDYAKVIVFYPAPFDPKTPDWAKHFIAYVRGATGVKKLEDLGYED